MWVCELSKCCKANKMAHYSSAPVLNFCVFAENILITQHYFIKHFKSTQPVRALPKEYFGSKGDDSCW